MNRYTVVNAYGEPLCELSGPLEQVLLNVPEDCVLLEGGPDGDWYDGTQWCTKPAQPSRYHAWVWAAHEWQDLRTPEQCAADTQAELDEAWAAVRKQRDALFAQTEWRRWRALDQGELVDPAWLDYWQALRDITDQPDPNNITWPVAPAEGS